MSLTNEELLQAFVEGDRNALDVLINRNYRLFAARVWQVVKGQDFQEALQHVLMHFCRYAAQYDRTRAGFTTFARAVMRTALSDWCRRQARWRRNELLSPYEMNLVVGDDLAPDSIVSEQERRSTLLDRLERLRVHAGVDDRAWAILRSRSQGVTMDAIGLEHGISKQRVQQIVELSYRKLRHANRLLRWFDDDL